jgi:O-antigen/teichoic acid export membrane protein
MKGMNEAKKRLLVNIGTNILAIVVSSLVGIWLTPYLIRNLGVELYGMVPLVLSISHYFELSTVSITGTVSRFVALYVDQKDIEKANSYFSTAFFSLILLCSLLLVPVILMAIWIARLFRVPAGYESQVGVLFFLVILSSFILALSSPFMVSTFIKHRFDLSNLAKILSKILQVMVLVLCFTLLSTSLSYVGLSYIGMAMVLFVSGVLFTRYLIPELRLRMGRSNLRALGEMVGMGAWVTINQVGALLYLSIDLAVINIFLGPLQGGRYAPITQWVALLALFGGAISGVFSPIAIEYIAKNGIKELVHQTQRGIRFMGMFLAFPIGLLCGLSQPLLRRWLGESFVDLSPLMWLLVGPGVVNIAVQPMFAVNRGMNKVKMPAIATIIGGMTNLVLSIILVRYTRLGIYGVAVATIICLTGKNLIFTPIYGAVITNQVKTKFFSCFVPGLVMLALIALGTLGFSRIYDLATIPRLFCTGAVTCIVGALVSYSIVMNKSDRSFVLSLIPKVKSKE